MIISKKDVFLPFLIWLILNILWNYAYPTAKPWQDVLMAVFLSFFSYFIKKIFQDTNNSK